MGNQFSRHLGSGADILFVLSYVLMPFAVSFLRDTIHDSPVLLYRIGTFSLFIYPLACAAMVQRMTTDESAKEGLRFLQGILWKWYSWPLGILFWAALLLHGVWMSMSFTWGEMIFGEGIHSRVTAFDAMVIWAGMAVFLALTVVILARLWGIGFSRLKKEFSEFGFNSTAPLSLRVMLVVMWLILGPIAVLIGISFLLAAPFYLYCLIWGYSLTRAASGRKMNHLIKDSRKVRSASTAVLMVYTVLMAYFFDAGVTHLAGISKQGGSVLPIWLAAVMAMAMFYFPFRIFFELANRRNIFGWIVFVVSISLVYLETMRRLTADI